MLIRTAARPWGSISLTPKLPILWCVGCLVPDKTLSLTRRLAWELFWEALPNRDKIGFSASEIDPDIIQVWKGKTGESASFIAAEDYLLS